MIEVRHPAPIFTDTDGTALDAGYIYVGVTGANPETNPQTVYWDKDGLIPAAQPIRTLNGYPARDGAAAKFYTSTPTYSITVKDKRGILVVSTLNNDSGIFDELSDSTGAAGVGYNNTTSDLAATNVQTAIDEVVVDLNALRDTFSGVINLFANGAFLINQRGYVSGTPTTGANQYTLDRIRVVVLGQNLTFFPSATFGNRIVAPAGGAEQVIEGNMITGGPYAVAWEGGGTIQINGASVANGATFSLTAGVDATVFMVGEFEQFRITRPEMVGRFEYNIERDTAFCTRYYEALSTCGFVGNASAGGQTVGNYVWFRSVKRAIPTITVGATYENTNVATSGATLISSSGFKYSGTATAAGSVALGRPVYVSAEF